jgi:hypothetical protein
MTNAPHYPQRLTRAARVALQLDAVAGWRWLLPLYRQRHQLDRYRNTMTACRLALATAHEINARHI